MNDLSSRYEFLLSQALECAELGQYEKASQLLRDAMKLRFDPRLARALDLVQIAMIRQEPSVRLHGTLGPLLNPMGSVESTLSAPIQSVVRSGLDDSRDFAAFDEEDLPSEGSLDLPVGEDPLNAPSMISFDDIDDLELFESEVSHDAVTAIAATPGPPDSGDSRPGYVRPAPPPLPSPPQRSEPPRSFSKHSVPTPDRGSSPPSGESVPAPPRGGGETQREQWARPAPRIGSAPGPAPQAPQSQPLPQTRATPDSGTRPPARQDEPATDPRRRAADQSGPATDPRRRSYEPSPPARPQSPPAGTSPPAQTEVRPSFAKRVSSDVFRLLEQGRFDDAMKRIEEAKGAERDDQWELLREHVESIWVSSLRRRLSPLSRTVQPAVHPSRLRYLGLDAHEAHVMSQLDGTLTIEDVVDISGKGELSGLRLIDRLMGRNLIRLR